MDRENKPHPYPPPNDSIFSSLFHNLPQLRPIPEPTIDSTFAQLGFLQRSILAILYGVRHLEYSVSPNGQIRYWIKLNLLIAFLILASMALFMPIITVICNEFSTLSDALKDAAFNLLYAAAPFLFFALVSLILLFLLKRIVIDLWFLYCRFTRKGDYYDPYG